MKRDKVKSYWFKRRRYGYGWTPVTWQGWLTVVLFLLVVLIGALILQDTPRNTFTAESFIFLVFLAVATVVAVVISLIKGPKPRWRWGSRSTDNPDEDI